MANVIHAAVGFFVVFFPPGEATVFRPVIGWKLDEAGVAKPITLEPLPDTYAVLCPNGQVRDTKTNSTFDSLALWEQEERT